MKIVFIILVKGYIEEFVYSYYLKTSEGWQVVAIYKLVPI